MRKKSEGESNSQKNIQVKKKMRISYHISFFVEESYKVINSAAKAMKEKNIIIRDWIIS